MSLRKSLRNLLHNFKDKASVIVASLSPKRQVSSLRIHVLRATTHRLSSPPSTSQIAAVLYAGRGSYSLSRTCIDTIMERLNRTRSATVALKCLFTLHNIIVSDQGTLTLKDNLSHYPSHGGHNALNASSFRDDTDVESLELSAWVRWYANVLEHVLTVSRVLGYYLTNSGDCTRESTVQELFCEIRGLLDFVEQVSHAPESLHLQKNELVYNVVRMVCEDYGSVQREILRRVGECGKRVEDLGVDELKEFVSYLKRMEGCRERLLVLFVNRKRNDAFWDLIGKVRDKGMVAIEEKEGNWLTVLKGINELAESTRFTNPFLEPREFMCSGPTGWRVATCQPVPTVG